MRRIILSIGAATLLAIASFGTVAAFEPPADPNDKFDGVSGFPGIRGQSVAMSKGVLGAWNAHIHAGPIEN